MAVFQTGWDSIDSTIKLDGRPIGGLPSSHLTTFIESDTWQPADYLWAQLKGQVNDGFIVWIDTMFQRVPTQAKNIILVRWHHDWNDFIDMLADICATTSMSAIVLDSARGIGESNKIKPLLREIQLRCVQHDMLGIFLSHESVDPGTGNTYWAAETPIRNYSSYVIGEGPRIVLSSVMGPGGNASWLPPRHA